MYDLQDAYNIYKFKININYLSHLKNPFFKAVFTIYLINLYKDKIKNFRYNYISAFMNL